MLKEFAFKQSKQYTKKDGSISTIYFTTKQIINIKNECGIPKGQINKKIDNINKLLYDYKKTSPFDTEKYKRIIEHINTIESVLFNENVIDTTNDTTNEIIIENA